MTSPYRSSSLQSGRTSERTAREIFFAMLGASSLCLLFGIAAAGRLLS